MKYGFQVLPEDIGLVNAPEIGSESKVKVSYEEISIVGELSQPAPASGTYAANVPAYDFPAGGDDLALLCRNAARSEVDIIIDLAVRFDDDTDGTARAAFAVPTYSKDQSDNLPQGLAVDIEPQGVGNDAKKIKAILGVSSVTGGAKGNRFQIVRLPSEASYSDINCKRRAEPTYPVPKSLPIACGSNPSAFTKAGRGDPGLLALEAAHFQYADGLTRLNGHRVTVMVEVLKDDRVLCERSVYGGWRGAASPNRGDGDDEVVATSEGNFESFAVFA